MIKYTISRQQYDYCASRILFRRLWVQWLVCAIGVVLSIVFLLLWQCVDENFFDDFTRSIGFTVGMIIVGIIVFEVLVAKSLKKFKPNANSDCLEYCIGIENDTLILQTPNANYRSNIADIKISSYKKFYTIQSKEYHLIVIRNDITTDFQNQLLKRIK